MANKIDADARAQRQEIWAKYQKYLDGMSSEALQADGELAPGTRAFDKLKELSDRLGEIQDKDFRARQLKQEIDQLLAAAGGGGGLLGAFQGLTAHGEDSFE